MLPRLIPLTVPWCVSLSAPFLRLAFSERERRLFVEFVGYYHALAQAEPRKPGGDAAGQPVAFEAVSFASVPGEFRSREDQLDVPYRLIRVVFHTVSAFRVLPEFSEGSVIDESAYDWSAVAGGQKQDETLRGWVDRMDDQWLESGICPDPGIYLVENAPWLPEVLAEEYHNGLKQYLLCGHDTSIDAIAESVEWFEGQPTD